jgi:cell shape-determining protein MreC
MFQLLGAMVAGFVAGLITRLFINKQQQKKVLRMENDMLKNHSRILTLQQKISQLENENRRLAGQ